MNGLLRLSRAIDRFNFVLGIIAAFAVLAAVLISAGNASVRKIFSVSSNAWLEVQWYLFTLTVMLGAAYTLQKNEHVRVDLVYANVSDRTRLWIDTLGLLFFLLPITGYLALETWPIFWDAFVTNEQSLNAGGLVRWPVKLILPVGFGLLFLQGLSELIKHVAALRGVLALDTHYEKPLQ